MEEAAGEEPGQQAVLDEEVVVAGSERPWGLLALEWMMGQEVVKHTGKPGVLQSLGSQRVRHN